MKLPRRPPSTHASSAMLIATTNFTLQASGMFTLNCDDMSLHRRFLLLGDIFCIQFAFCFRSPRIARYRYIGAAAMPWRGARAFSPEIYAASRRIARIPPHFARACRRRRAQDIIELFRPPREYSWPFDATTNIIPCQLYIRLWGFTRKTPRDRPVSPTILKARYFTFAISLHCRQLCRRQELMPDH